jgi:hypothetical protein
MRYTVIWRANAQADLARIWIAAADRQAVQRAADAIDRLLATSSFARGNDLPGLWDFTLWPLNVSFEVIPGDRKVIVYEVISVS